MKYIVECRKRDEAGNISGARFAGFGNGLPDKKTALNVFRREIASNAWGAVYLEKVTANGIAIDVDAWYAD